MPRIDEYEGQDALGLAAWVRAGEVSPQELLEAAVARVEARNPALNAVVIRAFEEGRKAIEAGLPDGPLRGVPWLLKDLHAAWKGVRAHQRLALLRRQRLRLRQPSSCCATGAPGSCCSGAPRRPSSALTSTTESIALRRDAQSVAADAHRGRLVGRRGRGGGGGNRARRARERRRRIDPHPRVVLRPVRAQAHARARAERARQVGEGWSGMSAAARGDRAPCATAPRCSTPWRARRSAIRTGRRRPRVRSSPRSARIRAGCASRSRRGAFNGAAVDPECVAAARDAADLCRGLGHEVEEAELAIDRELLAQVGGHDHRRQPARDAARARRRARPRGHGRRRRAAHVADGREAPSSASAADYASALRGIHRLGREVSRVPRALRRAAHADDGDTAAPARPPRSHAPRFRRPASPISRARSASRSSSTRRDTPRCRCRSPGARRACRSASSSPARFGDEATLFRLAAQLETARPWFDRRPPA